MVYLTRTDERLSIASKRKSRPYQGLLLILSICEGQSDIRIAVTPSGMCFESGDDRKAKAVYHFFAIVFRAECGCGEDGSARDAERIESFFDTAEYAVKAAVTDPCMDTKSKRKGFAGLMIRFVFINFKNSVICLL